MTSFTVPSDPNALITAQEAQHGALGRGFIQGATLNWADELAGLAGQDQAAFRARSRELANADPGSYRTGQFVGSLLSPVNALPAGWLFRGGAGLGRVAGVGAGLGATTGAIESLGEQDERRGLNAETAGRTALGATVGGAAGGAIAPALYAIGSGVRAGGRQLADYVTGSNRSGLAKVGQAIERQGGDIGAMSGQLTNDAGKAVQGIPEPVLTDVLRGLSAGQSASQVAANVILRHPGIRMSATQVGKIDAAFQRANPVPRNMLSLSEEVGGNEAARSGLTGLAQGVASLPGRGREVMLRNMGATMEAAPERLASRLASETGQGLDFRQAFNDRVAARQTAASQAYDAAYRQNVAGAIATGHALSADLQPILGRYAVRARTFGGERQSAIASAIETLGGTNRSNIPGQLGVQTLEQYHAARKEFDKMLAGLNRSPNAADRDAARILNQMRTEVNTAVGKNNPAFAAADKRFASDMAREEAMLIGRDYTLRAGSKQDDALRDLLALERRHPNHAEEIREHFTQGLLRKMADDVANKGGIPAELVQPLTGGIRPAPQQALNAALAAPLPTAKVAGRANKATGAVGGQPMPHQPGRQMAQGITGVLSDEARLKKTFTDVFGNSNTANKLAAQEDLRELPRIASEMATGGWLSGVRRAVVDRLIRAMTERNTEQIARIISETDPRLLYLAMQDIRRSAPLREAGNLSIGVPAVATGEAVGQQITGR